MDIIHSYQFKHILEKTIKGYHLINSVPIKEAVWENILSQTLKKCNCENVWNNGSHKSGRDFMIDNNGISCKSTKINSNSFSVSSYRMTLCNSGEEFTNEIDIVRNNFSHYLILGREESNNTLNYYLYVIPTEEVKAKNKIWETHYKLKTSNIQKWTTDSNNGYSMKVVSSMSNQLWINFDRTKFSKYCVISDVVVETETTIDYASLFDKLSITSS
jgi:hypothetical protein